LQTKLELRAITNSHLIRDNPVMISSTMPSAKYSCSGSPLMFWNGRTAIEGLSSSASPADGLSGVVGSACDAGLAGAGTPTSSE
jgi:hypothetical protein